MSSYQSDGFCANQRLAFDRFDASTIDWKKLPADIRSPWQIYQSELEHDFVQFKNLQSKLLLQLIHKDPDYAYKLFTLLPDARRKGALFFFVSFFCAFIYFVSRPQKQFGISIFFHSRITYLL